MVEATQVSHTLLLVNFRPEYQAPWTIKPHYHQLPLVPLGENDVRAMLASLLGEDQSVQALAEKIIGWTNGNPLYAEEVINTLIETEQLTGSRGAYRLNRSIDNLDVPSTVQSIIAARIDRLDENAKRILHGAAVIGKAFSRDLIARITELSPADLALAIDHLKSYDIIYETSLFPTLEYSLKHPLVHEVAYETQLNDSLAERHRLVAASIEQMEPQRLDGLASMIAYHWDRANDDLTAIRWHQRAATVAGLAEPRTARQHWVRVRELTDSLPVSQKVLAMGAEACSKLLSLGWRLGGNEENSEGYFEDGKSMAERGATTCC